MTAYHHPGWDGMTRGQKAEILDNVRSKILTYLPGPIGVSDIEDIVRWTIDAAGGAFDDLFETAFEAGVDDATGAATMKNASTG